jgi:hypothetical protein
MPAAITDGELKEDGTVEWRHLGTVVRPDLRPVTSALFDKRKGLVFLLVGPDPGNSVLLGLDAAGHERFRTQCPAGYTYGYLTRHVSGKPAVVCEMTKVVAGFPDWHFLIDPKTGRLTKSDPAY